MPIGILGIGLFLPEQVRKNDWWPAEVVRSWEENREAKNLGRAVREEVDPPTAGVRQTFAAMQRYASDPFKGGKERRVMSKGMRPSDMELAAGKDALARCGVPKEEVDLLLVHSSLPDQLISTNATLLHRELGLPTRCFSMSADAVCNSFLQQLALAEAMILQGRARHALLIQSSALLHIARPEDPHSAWFGDAATAVVVGEVSQGRGILGQAHFTDGSFHEALRGGCPGKPFFEADRIEMYVDRAQSRRMLMVIADLAKVAVDAALEQAQIRHEEVGFYATHQSTAWFREATQTHIGLPNARSFDSYAWTSSLGACNIPFMLGMAEREKGLLEDVLVAMHTGGSGVVWSGMALRWGR